MGFPQPWERLVSAPGGGAADIDVAVEALGAPLAPPLLTRRASTRFVPGKTELLRLQLELPCVVYPPRPDGIKMPGPLSGPTCVAPMTCIMGSCQSDVVRPDGLEPYAPDWPTNAPDRCKRRNAGPPALQIGTGQTSYLPLAPGQTLQAEAGPQGGHHIWIATRMKNLKQRLTTTRIEGVQPENARDHPPSTFVFTYAPDEGGLLQALRPALPARQPGNRLQAQFLGKALDVVVTLTDTSGSTAKATARIQVAPTLVNP